LCAVDFFFIKTNDAQKLNNAKRAKGQSAKKAKGQSAKGKKAEAPT
jgi:hypothetical protein